MKTTTKTQKSSKPSDSRTGHPAHQGYCCNDIAVAGAKTYTIVTQLVAVWCRCRVVLPTEDKPSQALKEAILAGGKQVGGQHLKNLGFKG